MAKKTNSKEAPANGAQVSAAAEQKAANVNSVTITTTAGHTLKVKKPEVYGGHLMIGGSYDGNYYKNARDRALTPEQAQKYINLNKVNTTEAIKYAASAALPHFVDDKAYGNTHGEVAGKEVNYITVEKIPEKDKDGNKLEFAGEWRLSTGISKSTPDKEPYRVSVILNKDEVATYHNRAETHYVDKAQVIGEPVSLLQLANMAVNRKIKADVTRNNAKSYDWSKFTLPQGATVTSKPQVVYSPKEPGKAWINVDVNGSRIRSLLTEFQTVALKNNFATVEQILAANKDAREKVNVIMQLANGEQEQKSSGMKR